MKQKAILTLREGIKYEVIQEKGASLDTLSKWVKSAPADSIFCFQFDNGEAVIRRSDIILFTLEDVIGE